MNKYRKEQPELRIHFVPGAMRGPHKFYLWGEVRKPGFSHVSIAFAPVEKL